MRSSSVKLPRIALDLQLVSAELIQTDDKDEYVLCLARRLKIMHQIIRERLIESRDKFKRYYDQRSKNRDYPVLAYVWRCVPRRKPHMPKKLTHIWHGPYKIFKRNIQFFYLFQSLLGQKLEHPVHVSYLKNLSIDGFVQWVIPMTVILRFPTILACVRPRKLLLIYPANRQ